MSDETANHLKEAKAAHDQYRGSGKALMATVITLAAGGLFGLRPTESGRRDLAVALFLPIVLALLQQLLHYVGQLLEARAAIAWLPFPSGLNVLNSNALSIEEKKGILASRMKQMELMAFRQKWATRSFAYADWFCVLAVVTIIASGTWMICALPLRGAAGKAALPVIEGSR